MITRSSSGAQGSAGAGESKAAAGAGAGAPAGAPAGAATTPTIALDYGSMPESARRRAATRCSLVNSLVNFGGAAALLHNSSSIISLI
jgi:hypothetical protein